MDATSAIGVIHDPRLELPELDLEIERVQAVLEQLLERRIAVKRQINSQYSPILQLPVEVLSNIFMACYPVNDRERWVSESPFLLGSICSTLRAAAWSTSRLWSTLSLAIGEGPYSRDRFILFRDWFLRARDQPLSLTFKYTPLYLGGDSDNDSFHYESLVGPELIRDTLDLIVQCYERWENVDLELHESLQSEGYSFEKGFLQLKSLRLSGFAYQTGDLKDFHSAPQLREVCLSTFDDVATPVLNLPQNPNMRLILEGSTIPDCLQILRHRPNFIHLEFRYIMLPSLGTTFEPVTAPLLQSLVVAHVEMGMRNAANGSGVFKLLENLTAPALHSLSIEARDDSLFETSGLSNFISRSGCTLKKLSINCNSIDLVSCLSVTPALTELDVCVDDTAGEIWTSLAGDLGPSDVHVPNLTHFTFTHSVGGTLESGPLASMLASRRQPITPGSNVFMRLVEFKVIYGESKSGLDPRTLDDNILEESVDLRSE